MNEIKDRVRALRREKKMTQAELAAACGVRQQNIQQVEAGQVKSPRFLIELASALGVNARWLSTGKGDKELLKEAAVRTSQAVSAVMEKGMTYSSGDLPGEKVPTDTERKSRDIENSLKLLADSVADLDEALKDDVVAMVSKYLKNPQATDTYLRAIAAIITSR